VSSISMITARRKSTVLSSGDTPDRGGENLCCFEIIGNNQEYGRKDYDDDGYTRTPPSAVQVGRVNRFKEICE
jgi:hypothetical protein